ncbi:MAG: hypothetical protein MJA30_01600 [Cytophagales bacterium]|nr:hypothetical protein [Cytophagales bacterium]
MKISHYLLVALIFWSDCKNFNSEKTTEKDIITEEDQQELGELLSSETVANEDSLSDKAVTTSMENESPELISYEVNRRECEKCDGQKVLAVSQSMDDLNYQLIYDLLCTFDESCSKNVEYSEFSNEVLYKVLSKHPKAIVELISDSPELDSEYIYKQISFPLLDYDYSAIINSLEEIEGNEKVKTLIIKSLQKAIEG